MRGYFIAGTDTGVGKTWVTAGLAAGFRSRGLRVAGLKPVSTGADAEMGDISHDLRLIASFTGQSMLDRRTFPYTFQPPISPHIAAKRAGICIDLEKICTLAWEVAAESDLLLVEGTGGWLTPISDTATMADLASALGLPVILVVGLRLGCLNHALLTARAITSSGLPLAGWIGNALDPAMLEPQAQLDTLQSRLHGEPLAVLPHHDSIAPALAPLRAAVQRLLESERGPGATQA
jgi:dethiobiotin synthetase